MNQRMYSTSEVSEIVGMKPARIDYWVRTGLISSSISVANGSGTRRIFNFEDVVQLRFISRLLTNGWSLQKIRNAVSILRQIMGDPDPLKHAVIVGDRHSILALARTIDGERIVIDALSTGGQQVMSIVLEVLISETKDIVQQVYS